MRHACWFYTMMQEPLVGLHQEMLVFKSVGTAYRLQLCRWCCSHYDWHLWHVLIVEGSIQLCVLLVCWLLRLWTHNLYTAAMIMTVSKVACCQLRGHIYVGLEGFTLAASRSSDCAAQAGQERSQGPVEESWVSTKIYLTMQEQQAV